MLDGVVECVVPDLVGVNLAGCSIWIDAARVAQPPARALDAAGPELAGNRRGSAVDRREAVKILFREDRAQAYDFDRSPELIRLAGKSNVALPSENLAEWKKIQRNLMARVGSQRTAFNSQPHIEGHKRAMDGLFEAREWLQDRVLDIGGGWGIYRQWWEPGESGVFVVHDPGVERFEHAASALHQTHYARAFGLPMTFVEGFGEELPYADESFDTCLIVSALDHCLDPERVLAEARRCTKRGGRLLLISHCHGHEHAEGGGGEPVSSSPLRRVAGLPRATARAIYRSFVPRPSMHLHHWDADELSALVEQSDFSVASCDRVPFDDKLVHALEARKAD